MTPGLSVFGIPGIPEVESGDDVASLVLAAATGAYALSDGDVLVVAQKIVSKAEGRLVEADDDAKTALAEAEAVRVLRRRGTLIIAETRHGFVCANAGVDLSNTEPGHALLLPVDPDRSAHRIRSAIARAGLSVGVVVSDTFGRPWRQGVTDVALGCSGIAAIVDLRGGRDAYGRTLVATQVCVVDEIAGAAELVMGKAAGVPAAVVRGVDPAWLRESSVGREVVRRPADDLFR